MLAGAVALGAACAIVGSFVLLTADATPVSHPVAVSTAPVRLGKLSSLVSADGILTQRARPDGSPYVAINRARGTYTMLPAPGDVVRCGEVFYRVDDRPVLLLCGSVPAYRDLHEGDAGSDVRQLNRNLHEHGAGFTAATTAALEALQRAKAMAVTGALDLGDAVVLPGPVRIAKVTGVLGGVAGPGEQVAHATSDTLEVHVDLDPSQQGEVQKGDRARITLPGNVSVTGRVEASGRVSLDHPGKAHGLDRVPVHVDITTKGVDRALSVPVTAILGKDGGGYAVEVVRKGDRRQLVGVKLGLFDTTAGRVQVLGGVRAGDDVVVPSP